MSAQAKVPNGRPAYTLLEVLLAMAISLMLLAALYVAMNIQLRQEQIGRDVVEESALARGILNKLDRDISGSIGPLNPTLVSPTATSSSSGATGAATTTSTATTTTTPAAGGTSGAAGGASGGGGGSSGASTGPSSTITFNLGLTGDSSSLTIYTCRPIRTFTTNGFTTDQSAPAPLTDGSTLVAGNMSGDGQQLPLTDVRRIVFQMGGGDQRGLQRQEAIVLAAYDTSLQQYVADDPTSDVQFQTLAEEVDSLTFQYYDPQSGWVDTWPQGASAYDGTTPLGPPLAIQITIHIASVDKFSAGDEDSGRTYTHVISLLTADGAPQPQTTTSGTATNGTTTGQ